MCAQHRKAARPTGQNSRYCFRFLRAMPFWPRSTPGSEAIGVLCSRLERHFDAIRRETAVILKPVLAADGTDSEDVDGESSGDASGSADSATESAGRWQAHGEGLHSGVWLRCELWAHGKRQDRNCAALPTLGAILDSSVAIMRDPPGRVYLSLMLTGGDGTAVKPHSGPTNHRLRIHLPILLPQNGPQLSITVGGCRRPWVTGQCLVLDDSFEHSVDLRVAAHMSDTSATSSSTTTDGAATGEHALGCRARVLLVCDVWHPDAEWLVPCERRMSAAGS